MGNVCDEFAIDEDILLNLADDEVNSYWDKSFEFYMSVKDRDYDSLTEKQIAWLERIESDMEKQEIEEEMDIDGFEF